MIGGDNTPGAKPTVSTIEHVVLPPPDRVPAPTGATAAGCSVMFMWTVRVKPSWPYCERDRVGALRNAIHRSVEVQSKMTLVVSQRIRGFCRAVGFERVRCGLARGRVHDVARAVLARVRCGFVARFELVHLATGTSAPPRPRGSVITSCSVAQSPERFGSPRGQARRACYRLRGARRLESWPYRSALLPSANTIGREIAGARIVAIGRARDRDRIAVLEHLRRPARAAQDVAARISQRQFAVLPSSSVTSDKARNAD